MARPAGRLQPAVLRDQVRKQGQQAERQAGAGQAEKQRQPAPRQGFLGWAHSSSFFAPAPFSDAGMNGVLLDT